MNAGFDDVEMGYRKKRGSKNQTGNKLMKTRRTILSVIVGCACLLLSTSAWADYVSTVLADNPLAYWRFEDAASYDGAPVADSAPGGYSPGWYRNRGAVLPDIALVPGALGQAAQFNGTASDGNGNFVEIWDNEWAPSPYRLANLTSLSLEFWVKASPTASETYARFISRASGGTGNYWVGMATAGSYPGQPFIGVPGATWYAWPPNILTDGSWHHVVVTYSYDGANTTAELWIDAVSRGTHVQSGAFSGPPGNWQNLIIGAENHQAYVFNGLVGALDEVAIYNYPLNGNQILAHFNAIPEPGAIALLAVAGLSLLRRKR